MHIDGKPALTQFDTAIADYMALRNRLRNEIRLGGRENLDAIEFIWREIRTAP